MCRGSYAHGGHHRHGGYGHPFARHFAGQFASPLTQAPVNVQELDDRFELFLFAPGLSREDFQLKLADKTLSIKALAAPAAEPQDGQQWVRREYKPGGFERSFSLSDKIDIDQIQATYREGVLIITLPKHPDQVTHRRDLDLV